MLARLHRRTGQDDAVDLLVLQGLDGFRDSQVGLARSGRPDAEDHSVLVDGIDVPFLIERLRSDCLAACGQDVVGEHVGGTGFLARNDHRANALDRVCGEALAGAQHRDQLSDHIDGEVDRCR
jgi:hypothetical protein